MRAQTPSDAGCPRVEVWYGTVPENVQLPASKTVQNIDRENRLAVCQNAFHERGADTLIYDPADRPEFEFLQPSILTFGDLIEDINEVRNYVAHGCMVRGTNAH